MAGTVLLTGANSSLGIPAVEHLLESYPQFTLILTVRNASSDDVNTSELRETIARHPKAKASILELDLASLSATHALADTIKTGVESGKYPKLAVIICNAYYWNLVGDPELTPDGYDKTFQVSHISHAALVLRLLGSFDMNGRIVLLSSDAHWPGKNSMEKYPPTIPDDLDQMVHPAAGDDKQGLGFHRYATAKLAITTWLYPLNQHLQNDTNLATLTAVAINPGNLVDSRALRSNTPVSMARLQRFVLKPLLPLLRLAVDSTLRTAKPAGTDVVELALNAEYAGERGFFTLLRKDQSSTQSQEQGTQLRIWQKTLEWAKITKDNTTLQAGLD